VEYIPTDMFLRAYGQKTLLVHDGKASGAMVVKIMSGGLTAEDNVAIRLDFSKDIANRPVEIYVEARSTDAKGGSLKAGIFSRIENRPKCEKNIALTNNGDYELVKIGEGQFNSIKDYIYVSPSNINDSCPVYVRRIFCVKK